MPNSATLPEKERRLRRAALTVAHNRRPTRRVLPTFLLFMSLLQLSERTGSAGPNEGQGSSGFSWSQIYAQHAVGGFSMVGPNGTVFIVPYGYHADNPTVLGLSGSVNGLSPEPGQAHSIFSLGNHLWAGTPTQVVVAVNPTTYGKLKAGLPSGALQGRPGGQIPPPWRGLNGGMAPPEYLADLYWFVYKYKGNVVVIYTFSQAGKPGADLAIGTGIPLISGNPAINKIFDLPELSLIIRQQSKYGFAKDFAGYGFWNHQTYPKGVVYYPPYIAGGIHDGKGPLGIAHQLLENGTLPPGTTYRGQGLDAFAGLTKAANMKTMSRTRIPPGVAEALSSAGQTMRSSTEAASAARSALAAERLKEALEKAKELKEFGKP